ncbi:arsenate reductase ArsC [Proteinivorax hydrogeniformans]|uniref:Arsenate reductase ArsC n=1 Tax=Proteinivorax hydrogeniformans TaxID=1826727 RepID=A0AAU8HQX4_9FIRM
MKKSIGFICVGNSCRSQMAEGFAKKLGKNVFEVYSAGTEPAVKVNPNAVEVMKEAGIDITDQKPKVLKDIPNKLDIIITMGCNVQCPFVPHDHKEDWGLDDPVGKPIEEFRKTRDTIQKKMHDLIRRVQQGEV